MPENQEHEPSENGPSDNYAERYKQAHPDAVNDIVKAEEMAYAAAPEEDEANKIHYQADVIRGAANVIARDGFGAGIAMVQRRDAERMDREADEHRKLANDAADAVAAAYATTGPKAPTYTTEEHQQNIINVDYTLAKREQTLRNMIAGAERRLAGMKKREASLDAKTGLRRWLGERFTRSSLNDQSASTTATIAQHKDQLAELNAASDRNLDKQ